MARYIYPLFSTIDCTHPSKSESLLYNDMHVARIFNVFHVSSPGEIRKLRAVVVDIGFFIQLTSKSLVSELTLASQVVASFKQNKNNNSHVCSSIHWMGNQ